MEAVWLLGKAVLSYADAVQWIALNDPDQSELEPIAERLYDGGACC